MSRPSFSRDDKNHVSESVRKGNEIDVDSYHKTGYALMCTALTMDERSHVDEDKKSAVALYGKAIQEFERGAAAIDSIPELVKSSQAAWYERALSVKDKIIRDLQLAEERVTVLGEELKVSSSSSTEAAHVGTGNGRHRTLTKGGKLNHAIEIATIPPTPPATSSAKTIPKLKRAEYSRSLSNGRSGNNSPNSRRPVQSGLAIPRVPRQISLTRVPRPLSPKTSPAGSPGPATPLSQRKPLGALKNVEAAMAQQIMDHVIDNSPGITWDSIAGQEGAKQALQETVVWPLLQPEVFKGLLAPARGILLFGPPGNGKTMLAKAVATESKQVFFNISASALTSRWMGESEKLVRALFACARELQPSIIFIDEIDSILSTRKDSENDAVRRLKTEFLVQFDGVGTNSDERILVMGATNLPQELDLAALRRFTKRIMIPLPDDQARTAMIRRLLANRATALSESDYVEISRLTAGYSGSDLTALAKDAAMGPIREINPARMPFLQYEQIRLITLNDFQVATRRIRPSVPSSSLDEMKEWSLKYADCS